MNQKDPKLCRNILYQELPPEIVSLPVTSESGNTVNKFLFNTLPLSDSVHADEELHKAKIGISLMNNVRRRTKIRKRRMGLSQKDRRTLGLYRLPKFSITYEEALPMNKLWESYMCRFLNLDHMQGKEWYNPKTGNLWDQMSNTLMKADYHGALLKVASSKCITLNGLQGIVIFDTKYTFTVISKDDTCRTIPKQSCVFEVYLKKYKFTIFGKYFCLRTSERSTKKIKCAFIPVL